jgi:SAM-dependent methyltransferase
MMKGQSVVADVGSPARVLDLGCGFGFTTASLKEIWPKSEVFGTNFLDTPQGRMAQRLGSDWGFSILPDVSAIGQCDVVVAFEYFEHFAAPLAHLAEVLDCTEPKILLVNNTFTSPGLGHFPTYLIDGVPVGGRAVSKKFSAEMIRRGYKRIVTNVWNNRPMYWKRVDRCAT